MLKRNGVAIALFVLSLAAQAAAQQRGKTEKRPVAGRSGNERGNGTQSVAEEPPYVIGPEDVLDISVWKEQDFSRVVPVRPDGRISLPLLGDIQAAGFTPVQLASLITERLRKYVTQPQVTVIAVQINSRRVYVLGEVNRPGGVPMLPNMTVLQALSSAGGFTQFANPKAIFVLRNESGKQNRYVFNYKEMVRGEASGQIIFLKPGDTIVVP